nr:DUF3313 domain-containing protein [uncultured Dongia sp.]
MFTFKKAAPLLATALCVAVTACSTAEPVVYSGIASSPYLAPNRQDDSDRVPYRYLADVNWQKYERVFIEPVEIYRGPDQQFGDLSEDDKSTLATYMQRQFAETLRSRFIIATSPAPNTLRLKLTLTGAATSTPVLSTLLHFDISGGIYNGVQAVSGGEGLLTGSVLYATEIYDAPTGQLLAASVTKQYPNAFNLAAGFGSLAAAKTGIDKGADALLEELSKR